MKQLMNLRICFKKLLQEVAKGEEVIIISADGSVIQLVALPRTPQPVFGSAKGQVVIEEGFDDPIEGFEEYMP